MGYKNKEDAVKWRLAHKNEKKHYDKQNNQKVSVRKRAKENRQERLKTLQ